MTTLAQKMRLKPGQHGAVIGAPAGYLAELGGLPAGVEIATSLDGAFDWIQLFVKDRAELGAALPGAVAALRPAALLWITFPKGSSGIQTDFTRDRGWEVVKTAGLDRLTLISVNETWSAFSTRLTKAR